jgi:hypothetical protein
MTQPPLKPHDGQLAGHNHTCLLYANPAEQKQFLLPFVKDAMSRGEHCLFVCPEAAVDDWSIEMQAYGIDVRKHLESGSLVIATGEQWRETAFHSLTKARELWQYIDQNLAAFPVVRIIGDASWALLDPPIDADALCHWEATADLMYDGVSVRTVCMYDLRHHSPSEIRAALRTHPNVVLAGETLESPFYEASDILDQEPALNASDADEELIAQMLASLRNGS